MVVTLAFALLGALIDVPTRLEGEAYTVRETATVLRVHPKTVYRWLSDGNFPVAAFKVGAQWRIPATDLHQFLKGERRSK